MLALAACLEGLEALDLSEEATELVLHGNADKVFKLDAIA